VAEAPRWSLGTRIAFRFLFVFLLRREACRLRNYDDQF